MSYQDILKVVPTLQSAALVGSLTNKKKKKNLLGSAGNIIVGATLIKATAGYTG